MAQQFISALENELQDKTLVIKLTKAPSYISCFIPLDNIILIYGRELKKYVVPRTDEDENEGSFLSDGDVTGHPLETDLTTGNITACLMEQIDWIENLEEKKHLPVTLNQARRCLNLCNLKLNPPYSVWVVVDGNDSQRTVLLSSYKSNGWISRSWAIDKGFIVDLPSLESLKDVHTRYTSIKNPLITSQLSCTYCLRIEPVEDEPMVFYSYTKLQASWNTLKMNPPLNRSTEFKLVSKCKIGKGSGGLQFLWRQLLLIHQYIELINERLNKTCTDSNAKLPSCLSYLESFKKTIDEEIPIKRIGKLLREPVRGHSNISNTNLTEIINNLTSSERPGMDATDKLWYLFIECTTYQQLSACFKQFFIELQKKGTTGLYINSSNISCLAKCLQGTGGASILDPLEYLVEIGLEKLKKDILFIFSKSQIATLNSLNIPKLPKFNEVAASDWLPTVKKWFLWFSQVHCVLELLWNTQEALAFPNDSLLTLTSVALNLFTGPNSKVQSFEGLLENELQEIKTNLSLSTVNACRLDKDPHEWVLTLNTKLDGRNIQSVFYRGLRSPFPVVIKEEELSKSMTNLSLSEEKINYWAELYSISDEIDNWKS